MVGAAHVRDGREPDHRPADRRPQPAYRPARAGHRRGVACAPPGPARCVALAVFLGAAAAAQPALPRAGAARAWSRWWSTRTRKRFTDFPHAILGAGPGGRPGRRLARGHRHVRRLGRRPGCSALAVGPVDRRLRPDLRLPGRRGRPARSASQSVPARFGVPAALRASTVAHVVTFALFVWFGVLVGLGLALVGRAGARPRPPSSTSTRSSRRRPVPGQPGVLHRQRLRRHRACSCSPLADLVVTAGLRPDRLR